jgi:hypothetical protein
VSQKECWTFAVDLAGRCQAAAKRVQVSTYTTGSTAHWNSSAGACSHTPGRRYELDPSIPTLYSDWLVAIVLLAPTRRLRTVDAIESSEIKAVSIGGGVGSG